MIRKTDALSNVTCYVYDPLHRITSITYASGTGPYSSTPAKNFVYDNASVTINGTAIPISYPKKRMVEAFTGTTMLKLTDEAFRYDARGDLTDVYRVLPRRGAHGIRPTLGVNIVSQGWVQAVRGQSFHTLPFVLEQQLPPALRSSCPVGPKS